MARLSVISVNFASSRLLVECLSSLKDVNIDGGLETIIYDNGPVDEALGEIECQFPNTAIISSKRFISFGEANNIGAKQASGDYLFFLNPDTIVKPGAIESLLEFVSDNIRCGAAGPKLMNGVGKIELSHGPDPGIFSEAYTRVLKTIPESILMKSFGYGKTQKADWISVRQAGKFSISEKQK